MLKPISFKWNDDALASFEALKKALVVAPCYSYQTLKKNLFLSVMFQVLE